MAVCWSTFDKFKIRRIYWKWTWNLNTRASSIAFHIIKQINKYIYFFGDPLWVKSDILFLIIKSCSWLMQFIKETISQALWFIIHTTDSFSTSNGSVITELLTKNRNEVKSWKWKFIFSRTRILLCIFLYDSLVKCEKVQRDDIFSTHHNEIMWRMK